jgi:rhodanese-related sulfurtransferase
MMVESMPYKDIAKELIVLLSVSLFAALTVNFFSPKGIALFGDWDTSKGVISAKSKEDVISHDLEIEDVHTAKQIYDRGNAVFVDARAEDIFLEGRIKGAISLPAGQFDARIDRFKASYPLSTFIVTYCSGRECDDSHKLAQYLFMAGYTEISVFIDGYSGWKEAGFPIEQQ